MLDVEHAAASLPPAPTEDETLLSTLELGFSFKGSFLQVLPPPPGISPVPLGPLVEQAEPLVVPGAVGSHGFVERQIPDVSADAWSEASQGGGWFVFSGG